MLSYTGSRNLYADLTNNDSSSNLSFGDTLINEAIKFMLGDQAWYFLEAQATDTTVASQANYELPADFDKMNTVTITSGSTKYNPTPLKSRDDYDFMTESTQTSDIPQYYFIYDNTLYFWPTPSSAGNTITMNYKKRVVDLSQADYTTGTITTATNGDETIVGDSTVWVAGMAGRYIRITAPTGDHKWYKIASVTNNTNLELDVPYVGTSIAAGSATYTIGEMSVIPEKYQIAPVYHAAATYWMTNNESGRASNFMEMFEQSRKSMKFEESKKTTNSVLNNVNKNVIRNPNLFING